MTELNEDNCVLSKVELNTISELIANHIKNAKHEKLATDYFNSILQKIIKLNDMVKQMLEYKNEMAKSSKTWEKLIELHTKHKKIDNEIAKEKSNERG